MSKKRFDSPTTGRTERRGGGSTRRFTSSASSGRDTPDVAALLAVLAAIPGGGTAAQVAQAMKLGPTGSRQVGTVMRRLVEQGQVLEARPGRYQVSGAGGEFAVVIASDGAAGLIARFPDQTTKPVHPRFTIGARPNDVCQVVIGEDGLALVTRILRRSGREVIGTVNFRPGGLVFVPDARREGDMPVLSAFKDFDRSYKAGDRVLGTLEIDGEGRAGVNLTRILSEASPEVADFTYTCLTHDLPGEFPPDVEREAGSFPVTLVPGKREDLRQTLIFTIDPATAKDFDDAIGLVPRPGGGWILGVHIADVSHYVCEESRIDDEASARGTSIYLVNRVIPMLPEVLSNGLCSLVPKQDRYCLSVFLELDAHGKLVGKRCAETIIHSRHRLTYEEAMAILERKEPANQWPDELTTMVRQVSDIAQALRRGREKAGALNLYSVEHRFTLDAEGQPVQVDQESTDISHQLIEECMLLANRAVAEWLEDKGLPCVYRLHAPPDPEKLALFAQVIDAYGIDPTGYQDRFGLQRLLRRLEQEPRSARLVLNFMCLRAFKKAVYGIENIGHYALAFRSYAHFTSPIRRYPDLLVHRLVKRGLGLADYKTVEIRTTHLDALAKQSSWLEQRAETAERTLHARKSARYLSARIGEAFPGVVTGATGGGLFVQLLETGMEGMLPVRELHDDYYEYDPERLSLIGSRSGRVFGPGVEIDIRIAAVDIERSDVTFSLVATSTGPMKKPQGGESVVADLDRLMKRDTGQQQQGKRRIKDAKRHASETTTQRKQERHEQKRGARKERGKRRG